MTYNKEQAFYRHLQKNYNWRAFSINLLLGFFISCFSLLFRDAFLVIHYPPTAAVAIYWTSTVFFLYAFFKVKKNLDTPEKIDSLKRTSRTTTVLGQSAVILLLPAFGEQFANLLWFVAAMAACIVFASPFISHKRKLVICFLPLISLLVHYTYWNLFTGNTGVLEGILRGKKIHAVEVGFAVLLVVLFYSVYSTIFRTTNLSLILTIADENINRFTENYGLSEREKEVFKLVIEGKSTKELGAELYISPGTARNHLSNIFDKTGTHSRMELSSLFHHDFFDE